MFDFAEASRKGWAAPGARERRIAKMKAAHASGESQRRRLASRAAKAAVAAGAQGLPRWVPEDLADDYRELTKLYGEENAARTVRQMKREQEAAHG